MIELLRAWILPTAALFGVGGVGYLFGVAARKRDDIAAVEELLKAKRTKHDDVLKELAVFDEHTMEYRLEHPDTQKVLKQEWRYLEEGVRTLKQVLFKLVREV